MQFNNAQYITSVFNIKTIPDTGHPEVAFAGRSNVGKSTLINKVLNRKKLVQVSKSPGKTKALNYFEISSKYYFVDLPGYGYAKVSKSERKEWGKLLDDYFRNSKNLNGLVHIIDSRRGLQTVDWELIEFMGYIQKEINNKLNVLWILSKSDKLKKREQSQIYKKTLNELECHPEQLVFFSALNGQGLLEIRKLIMEMLTE